MEKTYKKKVDGKNDTGRPKIEIDYELLIKLAKIGLTNHQIANVLNVDVNIIENSYNKVIENNLPENYMKLRWQRFYKVCGNKLKGKLKYQEKKKIPSFKIKCNIHAQMMYHLKHRNISKTSKTFSLLGYTPKELIEHLEKKLIEGMTFNNYGKVWHIDHIKPESWFNYTNTNDEEFKKCWSLNNLQPLFAKDNFSKGNRWEG